VQNAHFSVQWLKNVQRKGKASVGFAESGLINLKYGEPPLSMVSNDFLQNSLKLLTIARNAGTKVESIDQY